MPLLHSPVRLCNNRRGLFLRKVVFQFRACGGPTQTGKLCKFYLKKSQDEGSFVSTELASLALALNYASNKVPTDLRFMGKISCVFFFSFLRRNKDEFKFTAGSRASVIRFSCVPQHWLITLLFFYRLLIPGNSNPFYFEISGKIR